MIIKKLVCLTVCAFAAASLFVGCAEDPNEVSSIKVEQMSLDAWVKINRPDLVQNKQTADGYSYYVEIDELGDKSARPIKDTTLWVRYDMTVRDLRGNIALTRSEGVARQVGQFTKYTHYVPYYRYSGNINSTLLEGTHALMRSTITLSEEYAAAHSLPTSVELREGSVVTAYFPSSLAYGSTGTSNDTGYGGQFVLDGLRPVIIKLRITDVVENPLKAEGTLIDEFLSQNGTVEPHPKKTINRQSTDRLSYDWNWVVDSLAHLYVDTKFTPKDKTGSTYNFVGTASDPVSSVVALDGKINKALYDRFGEGSRDGDSISSAHKAKIWYVARFLDGFVFDTNVDEVKKIVYGEVKSTGSATSFTADSKDNSSSFIKAWLYALPNLKYGQWATIITSSTYAYGSEGVAAAAKSSSSSSSSTALNNAYLNYYSMYNNYYGGYNSSSYYNSYYGSYNNGYFGNYSSGTTTTTENVKTTITTEILPYAPLIFEIYIEPLEEDE